MNHPINMDEKTVYIEKRRGGNGVLLIASQLEAI